MITSPEQPAERTSIDGVMLERAKDAEDARDHLRRQRTSSLFAAIFTACALLFGAATMRMGWSMAWGDPGANTSIGAVVGLLANQISVENALTLTLGAVGTCVAINVVLAFQNERSEDLITAVRFSQARSDLYQLARFVALGAVMVGIAVWFDFVPTSQTGGTAYLTAAAATGSSVAAAWLAAIAFERVSLADYYADLVYADQQLQLLRTWEQHLAAKGLASGSAPGPTARRSYLIRYTTAVLLTWCVIASLVVFTAALSASTSASPNISAWTMPGLITLTLVSTAVGVGIVYWQLSTRWRRYRAAGRWGWLRGPGSSVLTYLGFLTYGAAVATGVWASDGKALAAMLTFSIVVIPPAVIYILAWHSRRFHSRATWFVEPIWWNVRKYLEDTTTRYNAAKANATAGALQRTAT